MLLQNNTIAQPREFDVLCILHDVELGTYHAAFLESRETINPKERCDSITLRSKLHHNSGSETVEGAIGHLEELRATVPVLDENVWLDPIEWDGKVPVLLSVPNWKNKQ